MTNTINATENATIKYNDQLMTYEQFLEVAEIGNDGFLRDDDGNKIAFVCMDCGAIYPVDEANEVDYPNHGYACNDCNDRYFICDDCGSVCHEAMSLTTAYGDEICEYCYSDNYFTCEDCGEIFSTAEAHDVGEVWCYEWVCDDCYNENHSDFILDYGEKPYPHFFAIPGESTSLYMGVELELDKGDVNAMRNYSYNNAYFKHDGSLSNGVEVVTHPCTLAYHKTHIWDEIIALAKEGDLTSHDAGTCGLHVHVSRDYLGDDYSERELTCAKMTILVNRVWDDLFRFSRRTTDQVNDWCNLNSVGKPVKNLGEDFLAERVYKKQLHDRYQVLNFTNDNTVEFRVFRGTLRKQTLLATLEFVQNFCDYAKTHSIDDCAFAKFSDIVSQNDTEYLVDYCERRGLSGETREIPFRTVDTTELRFQAKKGDLIRVQKHLPMGEGVDSSVELGESVWCRFDSLDDDLNPIYTVIKYTRPWEYEPFLVGGEIIALASLQQA